jgi:hypothetical protein
MAGPKSTTIINRRVINMLVPSLNSMQKLWSMQQAKLHPAKSNGHNRLACVVNLVEKINQVSIHPKVQPIINVGLESGDE